MNNIERAYELMKNNEYHLALDLLNKTLPTATADEKFTIAEIYKTWGFLDEAKQLLIELHEQFPEESEIIISLSQVYIDQENDEKAMILLNKINKSDPSYLEALIQLADLYEAQGLYEVSEARLLEAKQIAPDEIVIDFALGELLFSIGKYERSITYYERVLVTSEIFNDVSIRLRLSEAYAGIGKYERALQFYHLVDDDDPNTLFKHGLTAFYAKERQIAIQKWNQLLEHDKYYYSAYVYLVKAYEEEGQIDEAFEIATDGLHIDAYYKELFYLTGKHTHQLGRTEEAIDYIHEAIALYPEYKEAVLFLVNYYKNQFQYESIVELLLDLNSMGIREPLYNWELAKAYIELEKYDSATEQYKITYDLLKHDSQF